MKLELKNISFSYKDNFVIKKLSHTFDSGKIHFIKGKNGSGKTTLLKLIATFLKPEFGNIIYNGIPLKEFKKNKDSIIYITHETMLYPELTLTENMEFFNKIYSLPKSNIDLIKEFNLKKFENTEIKKYSRGMKQKASISLSLMFEHQIYLFDEPFSGLDHISQETLKKKLEDLSKQDKLIILISHHINDIKNKITYELEHGKLKIIS